MMCGGVEWTPAACRLLEPGSLDATWFDAVRDFAARLPSLANGATGKAAIFPSVAEIDTALSRHAGVRFTAGDKLRRRRRPGRPIELDDVYEIRIASRREVPTRANNLHDLLNALVWAAFPAGKWALTRRLAEAQKARLAGRPWRLPGSRTRQHDRLALLDEGGILIAAGVAAARPMVFGHALLEHALARSVEVWGAALSFPVAPAASCAETRRQLDDALAAALERGGGFLEQPGPWPRLSLRTLAAAQYSGGA